MNSTVCNANFFNNGYEEFVKNDKFLNMCIETQKNLSDNKDIFYKIYDYNNEIVKEAKNKLEDYLNQIKIDFFEGDYVVKEFNEDDRLSLTVFVDTIKFYIQSKEKNTIFLDNDIFIYNKKDFLDSTLNKIVINKSLLDTEISSNSDNLKFFKEIFEFRVRNKIVKENFDDLSLIKKMNKEFKIESKVQGFIHFSKYNKRLKNLIIVKDYEDLKKVFSLKEKKFNIIILLNNKIKIPNKFKFLDFNKCDDFAKNKISSFFNL